MKPSIISPHHPVWAFAFRPIYLLCALYGALSILLWGFGYQGTPSLPAHYWHAHEMIWGYTGGIIAAFLLTAVATWTGQPPARGLILMGITGLWLAARFAAFLPHHLFTFVFGTLFYVATTISVAHSVFKSKNSRNYIVIIALTIFTLTHAYFHIQRLHPSSGLNHILYAGILMISAFIGLIGNRIIPFFTARRFNLTPVASPFPVILAALVLPTIAAIAIMIPHAITTFIFIICTLLAGLLALTQTWRWFDKRVLSEPLLWSLFLGYAMGGTGLTLLGLQFLFSTFSINIAPVALHLITVGSIGILTLSMMARTALGHTGRTIYPSPRAITWALALMFAATITRAIVYFMPNPTAYQHTLRLSAALFAIALIVYFARYFAWLTQKHADDKEG